VGRPLHFSGSLRRVFATAALTALTACASSADGVLIAAAGNWDAAYGEMNKRGIDLAIEQINQEGGVRGRPLRIVLRNDKGDGTRAVAIASEFVGDPKVVAVVGHVNSGTMIAAARVYDGGLPAVSTTASTPDLTGVSPWVFRVISSDSVNGLDLARHARAQGFRKGGDPLREQCVRTRARRVVRTQLRRTHRRERPDPLGGQQQRGAVPRVDRPTLP
jgi:branched-chain amino acid transport system substrate-binding protein